MKITLVILHTDPARGGAERYTVDLAAGLAARGHEVTLLGGAREASAPNVDCVEAGYVRVLVPIRGLTRSRKYECFARAAERWLTEHPQDVVHAMLPMRRCDVYHPHAGLAVNALEGKPVQTFFNPRRRLFAAIERELLGGARPPVVLCLSNYIKGELRESCPTLPPDRMVRLFNAVALDRFSPPESRPQGEPVEVLMVAQDFARKGLATAIRAVAQAPATKLTVVGRDDPAPYAALARKLGVEARVEFAGSQKDVRPFYRRAGFLVLPTKHDPCSLVVLEALACGLPVISTKFNGACEVMTHGEHGFVLDDPDDDRALADAMNPLVDPARRAAMQAACVALRPVLSYEHHLDEVEAIYRGVAENRARQR